MNYLRRKMDDRLLGWKRDERRLPLVVQGVRQVGKTESIRAFARANYTRFVEINFAEDPRFREVVQDGYATRDVLRNLTRIEPELRLEPGRTLLFFDEIQEFPDIASTLKFFAQDGRFDVSSAADRF